LRQKYASSNLIADLVFPTIIPPPQLEWSSFILILNLFCNSPWPPNPLIQGSPD
jgi:hypothetical protein